MRRVRFGVPVVVPTVFVVAGEKGARSDQFVAEIRAVTRSTW